MVSKNPLPDAPISSEPEPDATSALTSFVHAINPRPPFDPATLAKLNAPLDETNVETRTQPGRPPMRYLASHQAIRSANAIFGYGNWYSEVIDEKTIPFNQNGKDQLFVRAWVRVTVNGQDGNYTTFTDVGTSTAQSMSDGELDKAFKGAVSDAEKRALRHFGDQFGLILYDKDAVPTLSAPPSDAPPAQPVARRAPPPPASGGSARDTDPDNGTIPCSEPGCNGFVQGWQAPDGYVPVAKMAASQVRKVGANYCSSHYRARQQALAN